jgi:hypothetical protein
MIFGRLLPNWFLPAVDKPLALAVVYSGIYRNLPDY